MSTIPDSFLMVDPARLQEDIKFTQLMMDKMSEGYDSITNPMPMAEAAVFMSLASRKVTLEQVLEGSYS